jgi:hypothetical protein
MEGGVVCRSSAHGGSRMRELDIAGERERERENKVLLMGDRA